MANPYDQYFSPSQTQSAQPIQQQEPAQPVESNPYAAFFTPQKTERAAELESGEWLLKDNVSTALAVLEGATLGWSDEIGVATAAAAVASTGEETYEQAYSRLKSDYDAMQKSYTARHPYAAGAAEFSGALLSPISKIGAAAKGATTITGLATRGAVEGAVYGAGKAEDTSSIADEAKKGAMFGAAAGSVLSAGGWLFKRKIEVYGKGNNIRSWIHVEDHCSGLILAMNFGVKGNVYNFGDVDKITNIEIVKLLLSITNKRDDLIEFVTDRLGHDFRYALDSTKAKQELGWAPNKSIAKNLAEIVDWYQTQGALLLKEKKA